LKTCKYNGPLFQGANHVKITMERPEIGSMWKQEQLSKSFVRLVLNKLHIHTYAMDILEVAIRVNGFTVNGIHCKIDF
jgi:hypothetical protein